MQNISPAVMRAAADRLTSAEVQQGLDDRRSAGFSVSTDDGSLTGSYLQLDAGMFDESVSSFISGIPQSSNGEGDKNRAVSAANLACLRHIDLGGNRLGPAAARSLSPLILAVPPAATVDLRDNPLGVTTPAGGGASDSDDDVPADGPSRAAEVVSPAALVLLSTPLFTRVVTLNLHHCARRCSGSLGCGTALRR
eukprot:TRINITY_DN55797_c0_g1_i1.p2 TRINITY_DN55797_c0_g1~~TRINITY_DN55797_c0_g1_i1.p2  ORF type:complete len:195 (+),score=18.26 TRINITY_DN55797_c0_g1_i1:177-761(+)